MRVIIEVWRNNREKRWVQAMPTTVAWERAAAALTAAGGDVSCGRKSDSWCSEICRAVQEASFAEVPMVSVLFAVADVGKVAQAAAGAGQIGQWCEIVEATPEALKERERFALERGYRYRVQ